LEVTLAAGPQKSAEQGHRQENSSETEGARETLRSHQRLRDPRDFQLVYAAQKAVRAPSVVVFYCPNGLKNSRLGVSVGRKHGNAVKRNRIKRVFRSAFRQCRHLLPPGHDYILVPRQGVEYSAAMVREALEKAARRML
jgi:ribonuclease P protein component